MIVRRLLSRARIAPASLLALLFATSLHAGCGGGEIGDAALAGPASSGGSSAGGAGGGSGSGEAGGPSAGKGGMVGAAGAKAGAGGAAGQGGAAIGSATLSQGPYALIIDEGGTSIRLERDSVVLVRLPLAAFTLGVVAGIDETFNYDPYPLYVKVGLFDEPDGLEFVAPTGASITAATDKQVTIALTYPGGGAAEVTVEAGAEGTYKLRWLPSDGSRSPYMRLGARSNDTEAFYGLGEYFDDVNSRGKLRAMQIEADSSIESAYNEAHVPIPFVIGTTGWGLFVASRYPGVFSLGQAEPDLVEATFGLGSAAFREGLTFYLFAAGHPLDVTRRYYDIAGDPRLPAPWALGPWIWRDENDDQAQVESDLDKIRELDLATSGYWIDRPYASGVNTFDFDPGKFASPQAMIDKMHAMGFRTALWHTPYIDEKDPATKALLEEATSKGYYPKKTGVTFNKWGKPIDLTNTEAYAWWQGLIKKYQAMGVEGYKMDYGEDVLPGIGSVRTVWEFADGSDERTMHGAFQLFYHQVYGDTLPADGGFLLCRHSTWGDQKNVNVIWPGDLDATFARHREKAKDENGDSYTSVGGLPASMIAGLTLGPSGFPFYGSDTGGYRHSPPDKELFVRWFEQTALSSVMQVGTSSNTVAWEADKNPGFDGEVVDLYRLYTRLHLRLFPYEWTYAKAIAKTGRPIQRPVGLAYPDMGQHPNDEYLFGDDLLVAPVVERDQRERAVLFPPGGWYDWWSGERVEGGGSKSVKADLGTLPLYLREGGLVPLLRPTIDTMAPTTIPDKVDSFATAAGVLWVRAASGAAGSFTLYDDSKITMSEGALPSFSVEGGQVFTSGVVIEWINASGAPGGVAALSPKVDGADLASQPTLDDLAAAESGFAVVGGSLFVKVPAGKHEVTVAP